MRISIMQLVLLVVIFLLLFHSNSQIIKNFRKLVKQFFKQILK